MAGDWIKLEKATFEKPEVIALASIFDLPEPAIVGLLAWVWQWFDTQTIDGNAVSVSKSFLNRKLGVSGFAEAMISTGWLIENEGENGGISMPNFERHTSKSAKNRALTAARVAKHTANAKLTQASLPEKRREEVKEKTPLESKRKVKKFQKPTLENLLVYCNEKGIPENNAQDFFDYFESNGWRVGRNPMKSWQHAFSRWSRENAKRTETRKRPNAAESAHNAYKAYAAADTGEMDSGTVRQVASEVRSQVVEFSPHRGNGKASDG